MKYLLPNDTIHFSDTGIVINISILQWIVEVAAYIFTFLYMVYVAGNSSVLDKFFTLFMTGFTIIVLPAFYLNGDIEFRTDLAENGYFTALKNAIAWGPISRRPRTKHRAQLISITLCRLHLRLCRGGAWART